jgi:hypothetical protein
VEVGQKKLYKGVRKRLKAEKRQKLTNDGKEMRCIWKKFEREERKGTARAAARSRTAAEIRWR